MILLRKHTQEFGYIKTTDAKPSSGEKFENNFHLSIININIRNSDIYETLQSTCLVWKI